MSTREDITLLLEFEARCRMLWGKETQTAIVGLTIKNFTVYLCSISQDCYLIYILKKLVCSCLYPLRNFTNGKSENGEIIGRPKRILRSWRYSTYSSSLWSATYERGASWLTTGSVILKKTLKRQLSTVRVALCQTTLFYLTKSLIELSNMMMWRLGYSWTRKCNEMFMTDCLWLFLIITLSKSIYVSLFRLFFYHLKEFLELVFSHFGIQVKFLLLIFLIRNLILWIRHFSIKSKHLDYIFELKIDFESLQSMTETIDCNSSIWLAYLSKYSLDFLIAHHFISGVIFLVILRLWCFLNLIGLARCSADFSFYDWPWLFIWPSLNVLTKWHRYFTLLFRLLTLVTCGVYLIISEQILIIWVIVIKDSFILMFAYIGMLSKFFINDVHAFVDD